MNTYLIKFQHKNASTGEKVQGMRGWGGGTLWSP